MRINIEQRRKNTYNFLMEVYELTKEDYTKISLHNLAHKYRVSNAIGTELKKNKIVLSKSFGHSTRFIYKWNSTRPNYKMVEKLIILSNEYFAKYNKNKKEKQEKEIINPIIKVTETVKKVTDIGRDKVEVVKQKEINIFWGLIKIKY